MNINHNNDTVYELTDDDVDYLIRCLDEDGNLAAEEPRSLEVLARERARALRHN